jgi:hypothetical protein
MSSVEPWLVELDIAHAAFNNWIYIYIYIYIVYIYIYIYIVYIYI